MDPYFVNKNDILGLEKDKDVKKKILRDGK
jgi:hypothetical protein